MKKNLKYIIIGVVLLGLVLGYYFYLSNRKPATEAEETTTEVSVVKSLLLKNIQNDYPPTPKEVVKLYAEMTTAFYTENCSDEDFNGLALKIRELYDDELLGANSEAIYLDRLKAEVNSMKSQGNIISSYSTSSSTDVDFFSQDGFKFARLNVAFTIKNGINVGLTKETFLLRKDSKGHWKIYGWVLAKEDEN